MSVWASLHRSMATWDAVVSRREPGWNLAVMRSMVGLALVLEMGRYCLTMAGRDVLVFAFSDVAYGGYRSVEPSLLLTLLGGAKPWNLALLAWTDLVCGFLLLVGLGGRLPALFGWLVTASILGLPSAVSGGSDLLLQTSLFTLAWADCTRTLSLDCRLARGTWTSVEVVPAWPRLLALWQLCVMYGATGLQKLVSTTWLPADDFSALYQILQSPHWMRFPGLIEDTHGTLVVPAAILTACTITWEISFPVVLFVRRLRLPYAAFGVLLHLGIWVTMQVGSFSLLALAFYPALFPGKFGDFNRKVFL